MNLKKLFEMQKVLDANIEEKHPLQEGENRTEKKILALLVEVGECANEWRGFKFWSKDQKPKRDFHTTQGATPENAAYFQCMNEDECGEHLGKGDFKNLFDEPNYDECPVCEVGAIFAFREKSPVLEEYVDKLHFLLSLGNDFKVSNEMERFTFKQKTITKQFLEIYLRTMDLYNTGSNENKRFYWGQLFNVFVELGEMLGFTWEEIENAYYEKNQINHKRQETGY